MKITDEPALNKEQIRRLEKENERLLSINEKLKNELLYLRRLLFGRSCERYIAQDPNQLKIDFGGLDCLPEEDQAVLEAAHETITYQRKKHKENPQQPKRQSLPGHLPRKEEIIEPDPIPKDCKHIGDEITEILEYTPGELYVRRIVRKKYALKNDEGIIIPDLPSLPLARSNAGSSLLAHLLVGKYQDHLPFYRQIEIFKRNGMQLSASTINGWFSAAVDLLTPLYDCLKQQILSSDYLQIDETTIPVVDKDRPGTTCKGYHWIVKAPEEQKLYFHYDRGSRAQHVVIDILKHFRGAVQSDGYGAYNLYENKNGVLLLGCWAHARRKFELALKNDPLRAGFALEQIQLLYRLERKVAEENLPKQEIEKQRKQIAYPILKSFEKWLDSEYHHVLPRSTIGQAISYTYNIYPRLVRYVIDGRYLIDNNGAENGVRALAIGRKNYLFCGNHDAARRTAIIYSLLGTCKINQVNPQKWLTDVFNKIQDCKINQLNKLLPNEWIKGINTKDKVML